MHGSAGLHEKFWAQKRTEKKRTLERTALAEHAHELARLNDAGDAPPGAGQKSLYKRAKKLLLSASRKPPRENAALRAKVRRDARRASRSARCFALDDGENLVWVMSQKQIERRREVAAAVAEASVQYDVKRVMALLRRESTVPPAPPTSCKHRRPSPTHPQLDAQPVFGAPSLSSRETPLLIHPPSPPFPLAPFPLTPSPSPHDLSPPPSPLMTGASLGRALQAWRPALDQRHQGPDRLARAQAAAQDAVDVSGQQAGPGPGTQGQGRQGQGARHRSGASRLIQRLARQAALLDARLTS